MAGLAIRDDARLAGLVSRYHTWPRSREQTVAEHSWQVARILLSIAPGYPSLLRHAILHDIGEIGTGDIPYPVKADNELLGRLLGDLEDQTIADLCGEWGLEEPGQLSEQERWVFKLAEFIEMWEWGLEELIRGNQFARLVAERCRAVIVKRIADSQDESVSIMATEYVAVREARWSSVAG